MNSTKSCRRSRIVYATCDTCTQKPAVLHKPAEAGAASYCEDCCPVCAAKSKLSRERFVKLSRSPSL